jgi:hypothetical protein
MTHNDPFKAVPPTATRTRSQRRKPTPKKYKVETPIGMDDLEFTGVMLGTASTKATARFARWTDMTLYRVTEGSNTGLYILEVVGCSDVFHRTDSEHHRADKKVCKGASNGDEIPSEDLSDDAEPCTECRPAGPFGRSALPEFVVTEVDLPQVSECPTPADVLAKIREGADGKVSIPAQRMLAQASAVDDDLGVALAVVRTL